ncbi:MAG: lysophospholipid acyltransferase family protein [Pontiellaceae bacterium]|nr:lysophospholipid acyltransferase family protein [Pontiellaceae bacterium]MBN2784558.1 lysophospholipid acyltransferase family protein [Pontiellaceae bacterium]
MKKTDYIEYGAVRFLLGLSRLLPEACVFGLYRGLGRLSCSLLARRRITALMNTEVVFPEKSEAERMQIVRTHFLNISESLALNTLIMSGRISNEELLDMVEADHWERLEHAVHDSPHGALFFSCHIGNWELMPQYAALRLKIKCHVIARKTDNALLEERIMLPLRERFGVRIFYKKNAMMKIMQATRKGEPAGIMIDQKLNIKEGIRTEFFGRMAGTTATPALLQIRFGITTIPVFMIRLAHKRYRMIIGEPVQWEDNGAPMEEQVAGLTAVHQKIAEQIILEYPEQWFWVHDRWGLWKARKKR